MIPGNSFHLYLEPDVPKSLFELMEDDPNMTNNSDDLKIQLHITMASVDTAEMIKEEEDGGKKKRNKKNKKEKLDISTLYLVRQNDLYDEEYDLDDLLGGLEKDLDGEQGSMDIGGRDGDDDEFQEYVLANLGTRGALQTQNKMNLVLDKETDANVQFVARGPRGIFLTGNYILD